VAPGRKLALLARREEGRLRFALRQGVGEPVGRAPWKIEWGGGASIENPHFQRVHYCELLVSFGCVVRTWALKVCMLEALGSTPSMCGLQGNFRNFWYCWLRTLLLLVAHPAVAGCAPCCCWLRTLLTLTCPARSATQVRDFLQRVKCGRFPPIEKVGPGCSTACSHWKE